MNAERDILLVCIGTTLLMIELIVMLTLTGGIRW